MFATFVSPLRRLLLAACTATLAIGVQAASTAGSGQVASETRAVAGFDRIATRGSIDLVVRQAQREAIEVKADDNLLALVETTVEQRGDTRTLTIGLRRGESVRTRHDIVVTVDVVSLKSIAAAGSGDVLLEALKTPALSISLSGSGDARLKQLAAGELSISVSGSGDVQAAGTASMLKLSIAGSGDVRAFDLVADDVSVRIAGSGDAKVTANKTLKVSIAGSGDVQYSGSGAVSSSVVGNGTVSRR